MLTTLAGVAGEEIGQIAVVGGLIIAGISIITSYRGRVRRTEALEQSRREIAAYVAEGSITPDDAAKLLEAGNADAIKRWQN